MVNSPKRSTPARKELRASNWFTMMLKSFKMWLNAPKLWDTTPSSMLPAKYRGATTAPGRIWMRNW